MKQPDVVLTIGHDLHPGNEGAKGQGISERRFWGKWARTIRRAIREDGRTCRVLRRRESVEGFSARQLEIVERVNALSPRLVLDLHFNAYDGEHEGCLAIHCPGSVRGEQAARALSVAIGAAQGNRVLPPMARRESWGGSELVILTRTMAPAVILEPFYGDVLRDYALGLAALQSGETQAAIARVCRELLGERVAGA